MSQLVLAITPIALYAAGSTAVAPSQNVTVPLVAPVNGATGVALSTLLNWGAVTGATSYEVYFGVSYPPPLLTSTTGTTYSPGTLTIGTTYYWQIVATGSFGTGASPVWSFTTQTAVVNHFSQIGIFRNSLSGSSAGFVLDSSGTNNYEPSDLQLFFGLPGDMPVAGDFQGNGVIEVGVFRCPAAGQGVCQFYIDWDNNGVWDSGDVIWNFGLPGDMPVIGDWTGNGVSKIGVFRCPPVGQPGVCTWILDAGNKHGYDPATAVTATYGLLGDLPVVNNWSGTGPADQVGVFRNGTWYVDNLGLNTYSPADAVYQYGLPGDRPVVGNWDGTSPKKIGIFRPSGGYWVLNLSGTNSFSLSDPVGYFGIPGDLPVVGFWTQP